ncbi:MAG: hypothetical protein J7J07_05540, partial [Syntrophobacterales bacterium]|nr:hypothetical protein [Syntrophobacterales bacterium]
LKVEKYHFVIPACLSVARRQAKVEIQSVQLAIRVLDSGFHRSDDFLRGHQGCQVQACLGAN